MTSERADEFERLIESMTNRLNSIHPNGDIPASEIRGWMQALREERQASASKAGEAVEPDAAFDQVYRDGGYVYGDDERRQARWWFACGMRNANTAPPQPAEAVNAARYRVLRSEASRDHKHHSQKCFHAGIEGWPVRDLGKSESDDCPVWSSMELTDDDLDAAIDAAIAAIGAQGVG